ncbi:DUF2384 domain-containing protein [Pseudomonas syringae]|nr:DUF2384 domain-containing protein [Pseudomonas syringae]
MVHSPSSKPYYQTPCSLLSTQSGYQRVHDVLMQIEYSVYI